MGNIGPWNMIIIAILVIVIFGGRRLPELGRGLGQGLANFRQALREKDRPAENTPPASPPAEETGPADRAGGGR
ncbi:MAG: twin-arginine translocase TatA/TatE family subunit [Candidatus Adiutrix sp.]|jgi:sec-independent protein translocase protein TatA|nr:twin-arginine translocase TatA/TatE family subunit [Candidatus Adiutrix sp.]